MTIPTYCRLPNVSKLLLLLYVVLRETHMFAYSVYLIQLFFGIIRAIEFLAARLLIREMGDSQGVQLKRQGLTFGYRCTSSWSDSVSIRF